MSQLPARADGELVVEQPEAMDASFWFPVLAAYLEPPQAYAASEAVVENSLAVVDRCRIRWGRVERVLAGRALVRSRALSWVDGRLRLGEPVLEEATIGADGTGLVPDLGVGVIYRLTHSSAAQ